MPQFGKFNGSATRRHISIIRMGTNDDNIQ